MNTRALRCVVGIVLLELAILVMVMVPPAWPWGLGLVLLGVLAFPPGRDR